MQLGYTEEELARMSRMTYSHNQTVEALNSKSGVRVKQLHLEITERDIVVADIMLNEAGISTYFDRGSNVKNDSK